VIEETKANDPAELKRRIVALEKQLKQPATAAIQAATAAAAKPVVKRVEVPALKESEIKRLEAAAGKFDAAAEKLQVFSVNASGSADTIRKALAAFNQQLEAINRPQRAPRPAMGIKPYIAPPSPRPVTPRQASGENDQLPKGERIVLTAIAQYPDGADRDQITVLTGYKRSTRDAYIQRLAERGFVSAESRIFATDEGVKALGDSFQPLPTGAALRDYWLDRLPQGEREILRVLIDAGGSPVEREQLTNITGYKRSTRDAYLQRLGSRRLVEVAGGGMVRAAGQLFEE
jgi:uncharacterized membrane protein